MPERLAGIDVADAGDAGLIEKEFFDGAFGGCQESREFLGGEFGRDGVDAEAGDGGVGFGGVIDLDAAEVAPVGETENTFVEFESYVHVGARFRFGFVGFGEEFFGVGEPEESAVEFKVEGEDASGQLEPEVFTFALDRLDFLAFGGAGELRGRLRFRGDSVEDVDAAYLARCDERPKSLGDGFYFW